MKKSIVTLALVVISLTAFAQRGGTPEERAENQTKRMTKSLGLSEEQQKKVLALNVAQAKSREENNNADREKMKAAREAYQKELATILTPEQLEKLKAQQEEMRRNRGGGRGEGRPRE